MYFEYLKTSRPTIFDIKFAVSSGATRNSGQVQNIHIIYYIIIQNTLIETV